MVYPCREEAARMWQKREGEWERERLARDRLMTDVSYITTSSWASLTVWGNRL